MSTTLPVPSKGALRALRNLALGTSCTVAFSAGLLTADRRRRIHAAREVRDNGRKIKATRQYHSAGTAINDVLDAKISEHDSGLWKSRERQDSTGKIGNFQSWKPVSLEIEAASPRKPGELKEHARVETLQRQEPRRADLHVPRRQLPEIYPPRLPTLSRREPASPKPAQETAGDIIDFRKPLEPSPKVYNRQQSLAHDITEMLADVQEASSIDAATMRFIEAFEEGIVLDGGLDRELVEAALKLSWACRKDGNREAVVKIFEIITSCGPLDEDMFFKFEPQAIINTLLGGTQPRKSRSVLKLEKACTLYATGFIKRSDTGVKTMPYQEMISLGVSMCKYACDFDLLDSVGPVFKRVMYFSECLGDFSNSAIDSMIYAAHQKKDYTAVIKLFKLHYTKRCPTQGDFYSTTKLIGEAIFEIGSSRTREKCLFKLLTMADQRGLKLSTTLCLRVFRQDWSSHHNLRLSQAFFNRLEPLLHVTTHPQQVYSAIIQHCVEANDDTAALSRYERMRKLYPVNPLDVRVYGHFAHAKAKRKDWAGVRRDFTAMKAMSPKVGEGHGGISRTNARLCRVFQESYSNTFTPILRRFSECHSISETESFLREFVSDFEVTLIPHITEVMIQRYLHEKELDSVSRWLEFMSSTATAISSDFFNNILRQCVERWNFSFEEVFQVFQSVSSLGDWVHGFINEESYALLRQFALRKNRNPAAALKRLRHLESKIGDRFDKSPLDAMIKIRLAMAEAAPSKALDLYKNALAKGQPLGPGALAVAVKASLQVYPDSIEMTLPLLRSAKSTGQDMFSAQSVIIIHQIGFATSLGNADIMDVARSIVASLDVNPSCTETRPKHIASFVISAMLRQAKYKEAISFWKFVSRRKGHPPIPLDLVILTGILQAYLGLRDVKGVSWVLQQLQEAQLVPDPTFKQQLKTAQREERERIGGSQETSYFLQHIQKSLDITQKLIADSAEGKVLVKDKITALMEKAIVAQAASHVASPLSHIPAGKSGSFYNDHEFMSSGDKDDALVSHTESKL